MTHPAYLCLQLTVDGVWSAKILDVPPIFQAEADRRMASPPTPDGQRYCLNRCPLPFYAWVRAQYRAYVEARTGRPWDGSIPAHPHVGTAPHWFAPLLEEAG